MINFIPPRPAPLRIALFLMALFLFTGALAWVSGSARAETLAQNQAEMRAKNKALPAGELKPTPWHLVDLWWNLGTNTPFESYSIDVDILDDVPTNINLYIAPAGLGKLSGAGFYGGLQTHSDGRSQADDDDLGIGRGIIFSRWDERDPAAIRPAAPGGYFQSAGNEGDFISARAPYSWTKGRYTYRVVKMDADEVHGTNGAWVGAFVYSHERHENAFIGALWFGGEHLVLDKSVASFLEIYGKQIPVSEIPTVRIRYENPTVNGRVIAHPRVTANFDRGIPDVADVQWRDGGVEVSVNATNQITRLKRHYSLHGAAGK